MFKIRHLKKNIIKRFWRVKGDGGGGMGVQKGSKTICASRRNILFRKKIFGGALFYIFRAYAPLP